MIGKKLDISRNLYIIVDICTEKILRLLYAVSDRIESKRTRKGMPNVRLSPEMFNGQDVRFNWHER